MNIRLLAAGRRDVVETSRSLEGDNCPMHGQRQWKAWTLRTYFKRLGIAIGGVIGAVTIGIALDEHLGIPFATTYRVECAVACLAFIFKLGRDYPSERWPRIGFFSALLVNLLLFFTPLVDRPASRGELMLFALPDAIVVLVALISSYKVIYVHQRAVRQQMVFSLIVAVVFCVILFALILANPHASKAN